MLKKTLKSVIPKLLYGALLIVAVQYYLVFPGLFAVLPSDFSTEHPGVTFGRVNADEASPKYIHFDAKNNDSDLVVFFHGNYETVDQNFSAIAQLTRMKNDVLLVEYPGYGDSKGWPMPGSIIKNTKDVISKYRKPDQALVLWGRSLGGAFAVEMATTHQPKALILESAFMHPLDALGGDLLVSVLSPFFFLDLDNQARISELDASIPVLLLHGNEDHLFDVNVSHKMKAAMIHLRVKQIIYDGGHNARNYDFGSITDFLDSISNF